MNKKEKEKIQEIHTTQQIQWLDSLIYNYNLILASNHPLSLYQYTVRPDRNMILEGNSLFSARSEGEWAWCVILILKLCLLVAENGASLQLKLEEIMVSCFIYLFFLNMPKSLL